MANKLEPFVAAAAMTLLVTSVGAVFIWATDFAILGLGEAALEYLGVLPRHWIEYHTDLLVQIAIWTALPLTLWLAIWMFRRVLEVERQPEADIS